MTRSMNNSHEGEMEADKSKPRRKTQPKASPSKKTTVTPPKATPPEPKPKAEKPPVVHDQPHVEAKAETHPTMAQSHEEEQKVKAGPMEQHGDRGTDTGMSLPGLSSDEIIEKNAGEPEEDKDWQPEDVAYACACGFLTQDPNEFRVHILNGRKNEPGVHATRGKIRPYTGEIVEPPREQPDKKSDEEKTGERGKAVIPPATIAAAATFIKVVPAVTTIEFSPIFRAYMELGFNEFHWPKETTLQMMLEKACLTSCEAWGYRLGGYEKIEREENDNGGQERSLEPASEKGNGHRGAASCPVG